MAAPYRCTVTIDGTKFDAVSSSIKFGTEKDKAGMPQMGSLTTEIRVWADFHDDQNIPFGTMNKLFTLANVVTRDKIKPIKIEFWKDDSHQDALASYSFNGWISRFETANPSDATRLLSLDSSTGNGHSKNFQGIAPQLNHMLVLDIEPVLNQQNFSDIRLSN
ncbi:MAG TPA: hypothetical protein VKX25_18715 [Bryobacteraceae bacterium]|jgi:hypothetical protein|nr:hypothetical protein [Bryobacteraceae bacterium]